MPRRAWAPAPRAPASTGSPAAAAPGPQGRVPPARAPRGSGGAGARAAAGRPGASGPWRPCGLHGRAPGGGGDRVRPGVWSLFDRSPCAVRLSLAAAVAGAVRMPDARASPAVRPAATGAPRAGRTLVPCHPAPVGSGAIRAGHPAAVRSEGVP
ncbi:hypothetical protein B5P21_10160 [Clavibacter michiganensis subsp. insidiosus]|nr:hypothetical protein B5P21_10160 [Clavibacter michiganensis subsp. insidiosus]